MKHLPILAVSVAVAACAAQPPAGVQPVGKSARSPQQVAQCVSQKWADKSQQPVTLQNRLANDQAFDVLLPGERPGGAAVVIQPDPSGKGSWVGIRGSGYRDATADVNSCL
jgi:opacity protein-like surface antigen